MRRIRARGLALSPVAFGLLVGLGGALGCETHIHGLSNGSVVYSDDVPPLATIPNANVTFASLEQQGVDVGGTQAFQKPGPGADEVQIGTSLPHTEVAFFLNDGDPEPVFRHLISLTSWDSIAVEDKLITSFGIAPKVSANLSDLSTWTTEGANGGGGPNQSADVALFKQKSGVWRMDHGACSLSVSKQAILTSAESQFKNQGSFPFNVSFSKFEGVSYM